MRRSINLRKCSTIRCGTISISREILHWPAAATIPLGNFVNPADIHPDDWTKTGVEAAYITYGSVAIPTSGQMQRRLYRRSSFHGIEIKPGGDLPLCDGVEAWIRTKRRDLSPTTGPMPFLENLGFGKGVATTKIAYVSDRAGAKEIYVMDYDGYGAFPLTSVRDLSLTPAWSPDSEHIAYMAYHGSVTNIEVISRNGGSPVPFPSPVGLNTTPAWSPDGKRIAFASNRDKHSTGDGPEIYIASSNGTNMIRLLPRSTASGIDTSPVWNPATGRELAFVSDRSGSQQIYRINDDGTNLRRLIDAGGDAENPSWSPDGNFLAFAWKKSGNSRFDIYLHDLVTGKKYPVDPECIRQRKTDMVSRRKTYRF